MSAPTKSTVPRTILLTRLLWRCGFCIFAVVAGNLVLMAVPQAREALQAALAPADAQPLRWSHVVFVGAMLYWAVSSWLVARLLLSRKIPNDSLGATGEDPYVNWVAVVVPRVLAFLALVPVSMLTWQINKCLGLIAFGASLLVLGLLVFRYRFGQVTETNMYGSFNLMGPVSRHAIWGLMALGTMLLGGLASLPLARALGVLWLLGATALYLRDAFHRWKGVSEERSKELNAETRKHWAAYATSMASGVGLLWLALASHSEIDFARRLTSPALLLFALGGWTVFGGFVLTYLPLSNRWIGLAPWLPPVLFVALSTHETHFVAQREALPTPPAAAAESASAPQDWRSTRETGSARFARWITQVPPGEPVYMVAAVGGASRAAYWTGAVLSRMEDEARQHGRRFAPNLFAISSISGGSLGATAFVAGLAQYPDTQRCMQGPMPAQALQPDTCLASRTTQFLAGDFLSPVIARMLFPDLFIRFVPVPQTWAARADRSLGLEDAWVDDWRAQSPSGASQVSWAKPITDLYQRAEEAGPPRLPTLLLNTVRLEDGQRFMQSNIKPDWPGTLDLLDPLLDTQRLTLAQAVHNSARFPYVSPPAMVLAAPPASSAPGTDKPARLGRLGDGGYHEGSGAATLADLLESLLERGQLRQGPKGQGLWACPSGWLADTPGLEACRVKASQVVVIILDSEPSHFPADYLRDLKGVAMPTRNAITTQSMALPELLGPVIGGLSTRTQLSRLSQQRLSHLVGDDPAALIELRMPWWRTTADATGSTAPACGGRRAQPSMNWQLDDCSLRRMDQASRPQAHLGEHTTLAEAALARNLTTLRELVLAPGRR